MPRVSNVSYSAGEPRGSELRQRWIPRSSFQKRPTPLDEAYGVALDLAEQQVYWTDMVTGKIQRTVMSGILPFFQDVLTGLTSPTAIVIAPPRPGDFNYDGAVDAADLTQWQGDFGIRRDAVDAMEHDIESLDIDAAQRKTIDDELEGTRVRQVALREQIDLLRSLLEDSKKSIGLDGEHFQSAISCALELLGAEPLTLLPRDKDDKLPQRMAFPLLDQREGAGPTWADTVDTLRPRRRRDQNVWQWRREADVRPVVFEDSGTLDDEVVHLHLEHRIVQRLLGRFSAQGFVHNDLSRACLAQSTDAVPRVALLGRLCLYSPGAARLHEELVPITARWSDPQVRKGELSPYARDAETKTLALLDDALLAGTGRSITDEIMKQLQASAPRDLQELLPHLQTRGEDYARDAVKKLIDRGVAEAKAMREILETQRKHIADMSAKLKKYDDKQMKLEFGELQEERRQLQSNQRHWEKRLGMLEVELLTEPQRIQDLYQVKATRIEPVGLVYLCR